MSEDYDRLKKQYDELVAKNEARLLIAPVRRGYEDGYAAGYAAALAATQTPEALPAMQEGEGQTFTTPYPDLNDLLQETYWMGKGPNNMDTGLAWFASLEKVMMALAQAVPAAASGAVAWLPMEAAPKDGTLVRLLVDFEHHATDDADGPLPTIGSNTWDNHHDFDEWQFAGWNWEQDCYTQGEGKPVGWLPMLDAPIAIPVAAATPTSEWMPFALTLSSALDRGDDAALLMDENSPLRDELRRLIAAERAALQSTQPNKGVSHG